jgi:cytochrome c-type biogenesis protein CcmF
VNDLWGRTGRGAVRFGRLLRLPRADWGRGFSHAGLGVTVFAVSAITAWQSEDIRVVQLGETFPLGAYMIRLDAVEDAPGPNYAAQIATMIIHANGQEVNRLYPEKRFYPVQGMPTTEAAIDQGFFRDIYLVLGDKQEVGGWAVRSYLKPFANWIWGGCLMMALGGFLSLSDRRHRVAAGARPTQGQPHEN